MIREVRWERMFIDELEAAFASCPLVYFPYGLCEPHGPQNAVGLDALKAHGLACAAARTGGGIVAPAHYWHIHELASCAGWGYQEIGEVERKWLTSIPPWHYLKSILYHIRAADALGFHGAILISGHSPTDREDLGVLAELVQPYVAVRLLGLLQGSGLEYGLDHAGRIETSMLSALEPECVDLSRIADAGDGSRWAMGDDAQQSDRRWGEDVVAAEAEWLAARGRELLDAYDCVRPSRGLQTFQDVEQLWDTVVVPELSQFQSMHDEWWVNPPPLPPPESVWYPNSMFPDGIPGR